MKYEHYQEYLARIPGLKAKPVPICLDEWGYVGVPPGSYKLVLAYAWAFHEMFRHSDLYLGAPRGGRADLRRQAGRQRFSYSRPREVGMRRVRYGVAMSLDGYIAGPKGEYDWIPMDPDIDFRALMARFDTFLVGRRTYEMMLGQGNAGKTPGIALVVFSRTLKAADHPDVTIVSGDAREAVLALKRKPGKEIALYGGGDLFRSLLELGVVDTVEVAVIPVLLGGGIPVLPAPAPRAKLTLTSQRRYEKTGTMMLEYDVEAGERRA